MASTENASRCCQGRLGLLLRSGEVACALVGAGEVVATVECVRVVGPKDPL